MVKTIINKDQTIITGEDPNIYVLMWGAMAPIHLLYISSTLTIWTIIVVSMLLTAIYWTSSTYKITIAKGLFILEKYAFGMQISCKELPFTSAFVEYGEIVFKQHESCFKIIWEREHLDTVELEIGNKYINIGDCQTEKPSIELMKALREAVKNDLSPDNVAILK